MTTRLLLGLMMALPVAGAVAQESSSFGGLHPRISPDGQSLALSYQGGIWKGAITGGDADTALIQLTTGAPWDIEPAWSPDGKRIAFLRTRNFYGGELRIIDAESGADIALPQKIRAEGKLYFNSDGKRLLGILGDARFSQRPAWLDLDSGLVTPLPIGPEDAAEIRRKRIKFALAPDDSRIIYAIHRDEVDQQGGNNGPQADLWSCAADGSNPQAIAEWPARIYDMSFDGNGALVVVTDLGTSHNDLWRLPLDAPVSGAEKLTFGQADDDRPSLDAAASLLAWSDNSAGATTIRLRRRDSNATRDWKPQRLEFAAPAGRLELSVRDAASGLPVAARVSIRSTAANGNFVAPPGSLYRLTGAVGHFYVAADGDAGFEVPAGEYQIQVLRGPEYRLRSATVTIEAGQTAQSTLELQRWIDMAKDGWFSGENHVHANYGYGEWYNTPATILRQCQGENLNVCNTVIANSDGEAIFDREFFLGQVDPRSTADTLMYWGQEFRSTLWGHMTLSNLSQLVEPIMTGFAATTNPWDVPTNADIARRTVELGGLIGYTHPAGNRLDLYDQAYAAKGLPVGAALGRVRLMDVMGHTYEGSTQLWYRLMNCGLRMVASSGTDCFLNRVRSLPPGWARTYVQLDDGLDYRQWTAGQAAGRSFITSAPMLEFEVEGAQGMGAELALQAPGKVRVKARAKSQFPMDRVELVRNGEVVETLPVSSAAGVFAAGFDGEIEVPESGWLALRAHGPAVAEVIREPNAHSNPVWIDVAGKPNSRTPREAAYFVKWIDRLEADFLERDRVPNAEHRRQVLQQLEKARAFYRGMRG